MADRTITITEPGDASTGVRIGLSRTDSGVKVHVIYEPPNGPTMGATLSPNDFTAAQRTQLQAVRAFILSIAKTKMGF